MTEGARTESPRKRGKGKGFDVADLLSQGRARAGGADGADDSTDDSSKAERRDSEDAGSPPPPPTPAPPVQEPEGAEPQPAAASQPRSAAAPRPKETAQAARSTRVEAMYVRVPADLKDRVDDASHQLRAMKATNQEIIAALIDQEVDPSTPAGLAAVRRRLERYRRTVLGS
jgi:hypothetical protein